MEFGTIKKTLASAAALILLALGAWFVFAPQGGGTVPSETRTHNSRRAEILELASRGARVSDGEKRRIFEYLSGEQFREYQFNDRERALILKAIGG